MYQIGMFLVASACLISYARALPVGCQDNTHCPTGFYCHQLFCQQCLECEDLKREPPRLSTPCVTSVTKCGPCLKGLVGIKRDSAKCVPPSSANDRGDQLLLPYEWAVIIIALLIAVVICVAAAYILRHFHTFKILACFVSARRTAVELADKNNTSMLPASAHQPPPPYNVVTSCTSSEHLEETHPFIQSIPPPRENGTRDYDEKQESILKSPPIYPDVTVQPGYELPTSSGHGHVLPTTTSIIQQSGTDEQYLMIPKINLLPATPTKEEKAESFNMPSSSQQLPPPL